MANVKFDKVVVWGGANGDGAGVGGFVRDLARVFPPVMEVMRDIGGVQLPESVLSFVPAESAAGAGAPGNGERVTAVEAKAASPAAMGGAPEPLAEAASTGGKVPAGS